MRARVNLNLLVVVCVDPGKNSERISGQAGRQRDGNASCGCCDLAILHKSQRASDSQLARTSSQSTNEPRLKRLPENSNLR